MGSCIEIAMRKKQEEEEAEVEILKAVAQAWHGHSGNNANATSELDAHRCNHKPRPSRFKLEAMNKKSKEETTTWDFEQSLLDSYEIVAVSKRIESGLNMSHEPAHHGTTHKKSRNTLRMLFSQAASKRLNIELFNGGDPKF
ncbi:hypothetical protein AMTRI_Chr06g199080 [Amborella trichopoda]|uniref:Uncharacterized protein n=1 Tax=Amborella trichopoda TaxID=13333 RepID=W1PUY5_AMBTC|nr:uncharacterized protein LOC18442080 [Amborella trichopoda]ERN13832.1 hypothetical protein AMTR_s00049p00221980 [Amborella trichopoda]|eukprot:XP_006852365.1 uncharacterized protein LOC18442080 [Amborella trichopoda]